LLKKANKIIEPLKLDEPAPRMFALSIFTLKNLVEMVIEEEKQINQVAEES